MYAIAIHGPAGRQAGAGARPVRHQAALLSRVRVGFAFASEPGRAARRRPGRRPARSPRPGRSCCSSSFTTGRETVFSGIRRVLPGETIAVVDGRVVERRRRAALPRAPGACEEAAALQQVEAALADSVRIHCRDDVPYGLFPVGRIDSSLVAQLHGGRRGAGADLRGRLRRWRRARRARRGAPDRPGLWRRPYRDRVRRGAISGSCCRRSRRRSTTRSPTMPACRPTSWPRRRAASSRSCSDREAADELFAGYGRYRSVIRPWWLGAG